MTTPARRLASRRHVTDRRIAPDPTIAPNPPPLPATGFALRPANAIAMLTPDFKTQIPSAGSSWQPIPDGSGWYEGYNTAGNLTAALGILDARFPAGLGAGNAPGTLYLDHPGKKLHWMAFYLTLGSGFQFSTGIQKTNYAKPDLGGDFAFELYGSGASCIFDCVTQVSSMPVTRLSTGRPQTPFNPQVEHLYETLIDYANHRIALGVDGKIVLDASGIAFPADDGIAETSLYLGWGGSGASLAAQQDAKVHGLLLAGL